MKALFLAAALACAPAAAEASITYSFTGTTFAPVNPDNPVGDDTGGSFRNLPSGDVAVDRFSRTVSGTLTIDTANLGGNAGNDALALYNGNGNPFALVTFVTGSPLGIDVRTGRVETQYFSSFLLEGDPNAPDTAGLGFVLSAPDYAFAFSLASLSQIGTIFLDGVYIPDLASATDLFFGVQSDVVTDAGLTQTFSLGRIDSFTLAVPEPATWALMIVGFGLVGGALRRRERGAVFA